MKLGRFLNGAFIAYRARYLHGKKKNDTKALVFEDAKTIYIPIPKAGNTSIRRALFPVMGIDPDARVNLHSGEEVTPFIQRCSEALPKAGPDWFVFTVVRHPYDRIFSGWREKLDRRARTFRPLITTGLTPGDSFETFLRVCNAWPTLQLNDHFMPQAELLRPAMAIRDIEVFRLEEMDAAQWSAICNRIEAQGGARPLPLPHIHSYANRGGQEYSRTALRLMRRLYGRDLDLLGYPPP